MILKKILFLLNILLLLSATAEEFPKMLGGNHEFFTKKKESLIVPDGKENLFMWTSSAKTEAYYPAVQNGKTITLYGQKVTSALIRFTNGHPSYVCLNLFGDNKDEIITAAQFRKNMKEIFKELKKRYPKTKAKILRSTLSDGLHLSALIWKTDKFACTMKWAISGNTKIGEDPKFLQVEFELLQAGKNPLKRGINKTIFGRPLEVKENKKTIRRDTTGDVYLENIPMIDQGATGNSAAAVVQRILQYEEKVTKEPIKAEPLKKGTKLNSDVEELHLQLKKICIDNKLKYKEEFVYFDKDRSLRKLQNLLGKYNRLAKKSGKEKLPVPKSGSAAAAETILKMDLELLAKARNEDHAAHTFHATIMQNVMSSKPLVWYVVYGAVKEEKAPAKPPKTHIRLIIGFNDTTREVIYTDSWGKGHELKKMPFDKAWAITLATYTITP